MQPANDGLRLHQERLDASFIFMRNSGRIQRMRRRKNSYSSKLMTRVPSSSRISLLIAGSESVGQESEDSEPYRRLVVLSQTGQISHRLKLTSACWTSCVPHTNIRGQRPESALFDAGQSLLAHRASGCLPQWDFPSPSWARAVVLYTSCSAHLRRFLFKDLSYQSQPQCSAVPS